MPETRTIIRIAEPKFLNMIVEIVGKSPLICSNGKQAVDELIAQERKPEGARTKRGPRDREKAFRSSLYEMGPGVYGFPATGIKRAVRDAGTRFTDEKGTHISGALQILTDFVQIEGDEPYMREDYVRHGGRTPDLAFRACFENWRMHVPIRVNSEVISEAQALTLFNLAGFAIGIGAWRPEKNGTFGQFEVTGVDVVPG